MKIAATASRARRPPELAGPLYCDASALVKLYVPEAESEELNRAVALAISGDAVSLVTYDRRLASAASSIGLSVFP